MRFSRSRTRALLVGVAALAIAGLCGPASAQSRRPGRGGQPQTPPTQPGQPGQPGQPAAGQPAAPVLKPSPFIKRTSPRRWTLTTNIFIGASQWLESQDGAQVPKHDTWEFDSATLVYPVLPETASSVLEVWGPPDKEVPAVDGHVEISDKSISDEVAIVTRTIGGEPLPSGTWRGQWQVPPSPSGSYSTREMEFQVSTSQVCYRTVFDEAGASKLDWPKGEWPPDAASTFQPQMFVDFDIQGAAYNPAPIAALLQEWTGGKDPHAVKPVVLAKFLAGKVLEHVQVNGEGLTFDRTGQLEGFDTPGASAAAIEKRGTELDLPCLLVAIYRAAGLPSRLVIGYDDQGGQKQIYLKKQKGGGELRVWVEFALYDEANQTFAWVPVDIVAMRRQQSKLPNDYLSRPLKYFGTHDELDHVAPIAFHFHPPTTVRSYGAPAMWGWFVTPAAPGRADQRVTFNMGTSPSGGSKESHLPAPKQ
ncbi:MAG: transglutaminase domain-containing protein [Phycisphaerales bacterium]|nr:transglutaminase domain-containing protein [Phycisphaerales bacterium]